MESYVIVDLEMCNVPRASRGNGVHLKNEVIQIGAVRLNEDLEVCDSFMSYVKPEFGVIDELIENLTGITEDDVRDAPYFEQAMVDFLSWLPRDAVLVSWSKSDEIQIRKESGAKNLYFPKLNGLLEEWIDCQRTFDDIMDTSMCYGLSDALNISSIDYDHHIHDALVDAKNTALLFAKMERERDQGFTLSPYISIGNGDNLSYSPFADLLRVCNFA